MVVKLVCVRESDLCNWAIGRLEVHMEIGLPDDSGREQIWKIHTAKVSRLTCSCVKWDIVC